VITAPWLEYAATKETLGSFSAIATNPLVVAFRVMATRRLIGMSNEHVIPDDAISASSIQPMSMCVYLPMKNSQCF